MQGGVCESWDMVTEASRRLIRRARALLKTLAAVGWQSKPGWLVHPQPRALSNSMAA